MSKLLIGSIKDRLDIASNKSTTSEILDVLAKDGNDLVVQEVSRHKNILSDTLDALSVHHDTQVLLNVANHPNTLIGTLKKMYGIHQYNWVNSVIVKRVGLEVMRKYLKEKDVELNDEEPASVKLENISKKDLDNLGKWVDSDNDEGGYSIDKIRVNINSNDYIFESADNDFEQKPDNIVVYNYWNHQEHITSGTREAIWENFLLPAKKEKENVILKNKINLDDKFGAGFLGGVDIVMWDRTVMEFRDYKRVGTINNNVITLSPDYQDNNQAIEFARNKVISHSYTSIMNMPINAKFPYAPKDIQEIATKIQSLEETIENFLNLKNIIDITNPNFKQNSDKSFKQHKIQMMLEINYLEHGEILGHDISKKEEFYNLLRENFDVDVNFKQTDDLNTIHEVKDGGMSSVKDYATRCDDTCGTIEDIIAMSTPVRDLEQ